jgi:hypothetical protein
MSDGVYTKQELIDKIKAIDLKLDKAISESELDTTQNRQTFEIEVKELRVQRDYYKNKLANCNNKNNGGELVTLVRPPRGYRRWGV